MATATGATKQSSSLFGQTGRALSNVGRWWLGQFLVLFPHHIAQRLMDSGTRNLLLRPGEGGTLCLLRNESGKVLATTTVSQAVELQPALQPFLHGRKLTLDKVMVGIELSAEKIFRREFLLPQEARNAVPTIAEQDLLRKTPFRISDVYHDHAAATAGAKIRVEQLIIQRAFVEEASQSLGFRPTDVDFIESVFPGRERPSCLRLRPLKAHASWSPKVLIGLATTAVLLGGLSASLESQRQQAVLDNLAAQITKARAEAQQVRATIDKAQQERTTLDQLRSRKGDAANTLDIWEDLSRILPSNSWLTELRISESSDRKDRKVIITGFSSAAADLVAIIDKSALFQDVALTAPIANDPAEQRERFVLQATVSPQAARAQR